MTGALGLAVASGLTDKPTVRPSLVGPAAESVLADIDRLSGEGLPLPDFVRACLAGMRGIVPFDMGATCVLAPEAQYERFVGCWPEWADRTLGARAFATSGAPACLARFWWALRVAVNSSGGSPYNSSATSSNWA